MRSLFALILIGVIACDEVPAGGIAEPAGTVIRNHRKNGWDAEHTWRLQVFGGIGSSDGTHGFGRVVDIAFDALGRLWVADGMEQRIDVFQIDGTHVRTIGRKGSGPAEFANLAGFDWAPDGTLWVVDGGNARFAVYDTAGRLVGTHARDSNLTIAPWPGGFDRLGRLTEVVSRRSKAEGMRTTLARYTPGLSGADTLRLPALEEQYFGEITSGDAQNRHIKRAPVPFTATQIWTVDPDGYVWFASTDRYRVERRGFDGTVERTIELRNTPRPVRRADKDHILRNFRWFEEAGGKLDRSRIPDVYPHLLSFSFDDAGYLWVFPTYLRGERPSIDIFAMDGRYQGQVQAPLPFLSLPAPAFRGDLVAAVARDTDGVDSIVLMRLDKPDRVDGRP